MKRTGKSKGIDISSINSISNLNKFKMALANVSDGVPVLEWKPYREPAALRRNIERCKELTALPSRFA